MKKQNLKNYLKIGILTFFLFLFFTNCENENLNKQIDNSTQNSKSKISHVTPDDIPNVINAISNNNPISSKSSTSKPSIENGTYTIELDDIIQVLDSLDNANYTFKITVPNSPINEFYNLIVRQQIDGTTQKPYVLKYVLQEDAVEAYFSNHEDFRFFKGHIYTYPFNNFISSLEAVSTFGKSSSTTCTNYCDDVYVPQFTEVESTTTEGNTTGSSSSGGSTEGSTTWTSSTDSGSSSGGTSGGAVLTYTATDCTCHTTHASGGCTHPEMTLTNIRIYQKSSYNKTSSECCDDIDVSNVAISTSSLSTSIATTLELGPSAETLWLNNYASNEQLTSISNFLTSNNNSEEAKTFAKSAIDALMNGGEVDFEDGIIVTISNECQKDVLIEGLDNCSPLSSLVIDIFGGGYDIDYIIESSDLGPNTSASTSNIVKYNTITKKCFIKATVDKNYLDTATDLSIARTIIHESLHATLTYMVVEGKFIYNGSPDSSFANVMNGYINYLETNNNDQYEGAQHEILLELVSEIATALKNYGVQNGYSLPSNFYSDLSWGGLTHLKDSSGAIIINPLFENAVPNANDRTRIINTIATEVTNSNQGSLTPKGKPCD